MKLEYLREFVALAQAGNFYETAGELHIARPTLSNHMRALEHELGFKLFDRSDSNRLTEAGAVFFEGMERAIAIFDAGLESGHAIASVREDGSEVVNISLRSSIFELRALLEKHCPYRYAYVEYDNKKPVMYSFAQGLADIMVVYDLDTIPFLRAQALEMGLCYESFGYEPCGIAMKETHPLAQGLLTRERLRGVEVTQLDVIESECWKIIITSLLGEDLDLKFSLTPMDNLLNIRIVDLKDTVFISMKSMLVQYFAPREGYIVRSLVDGFPLLLPRSLVYRPPSEKPHIAPVLTILREHLAEISLEPLAARGL